ncbi:hypothetical protein [Photobacterium damselae]|uniref:hypothetical protein n=1 Tax=Photobacterium damselae TaxID=38293 RepID=UPI0010FE9768|nr:hypothetical protein [Photobacterium damselae]ELV7517773.1 hypothetical protein [Photobacterium damselae]KAB1511991.1 hypothetical protein FD717_010430 [Photobacterium damselae subsp. damselae]TLS69579.1 hypothetical protein FD718_11600 [Photobacterium damselae subsp. damselae]TLS74573.1 hypothetical protein FD721_18410 [Photobacterium damselae subsp. damselae]TLS84136.1 hypothetical protein FD720_18275 [Photobacterium damselae subsp. damselae]
MTAIKIHVENGLVTVSYEEKTAENITRRLNQLKEALNVTWYGVATVLDMKPTEGSVRLFKRWVRDPSMSSYQEMPESKWMLLLTLIEGQTALK